MAKKSKATSPAMAGAVVGAHGGALAQGPCKLSPQPGTTNAFRCRAADMPLSCSLATPDGKTEFLSVEVRQASSLGTVVAGQPTSVTATGFTLNLQGGDYVVIVVVGALPTANPVWVTEDCAGATKLDWIAVPVNTTGEFSLKVV